MEILGQNIQELIQIYDSEKHEFRLEDKAGLVLFIWKADVRPWFFEFMNPFIITEYRNEP